MTTRALLASWGIGITVRAEDERLGITKDCAESRAKHKHPKESDIAKCDECWAVAWSPYELSDFHPGATAERLVVAWMGEEDNYARNTTHARRLRRFFGIDRFVDLAYAIAREHGIGPLAEGGEYQQPDGAIRGSEEGAGGAVIG